MLIEKTPFDGLLLITPKVFGDERGFFLESWNDERYRAAGITDLFVQDNWSRSRRGILRGLHFQNPKGAVWDVAVDLRPNSPTRFQWYGVELTEENKKQLWLPKGFAHGFCVVSDSADFVYKCTEKYRPEDERSLKWNDPTLNITWPVRDPLLSKKDAEAPTLEQLKASGHLP